MTSLEENKLMDKVSDVLRDINKSEKNIEKSYFSMSLFEIKHRNETNKVPEKKEESILSVPEKIRYGKIGDNFIKGASEEYIKIIENIKKEVRKKYKDKQKNIQRIESRETEEIKKETKKHKKSIKTKLILIGGAIAVSSFLLKKTYDFLLYYFNKFNFSKILSDYLPKKITYLKSKIDDMDDSVSSFVLETSSGEKINLTDESYSKNPIEEAAKSFDNILKVYVFDKGFNSLINNLKDENSIIGYLIFKPGTLIINKLMRFSNESLTTDHYFKGPGADLFRGLQSIHSIFSSNTLENILSKTYIGRYNSLLIKSSDAYYNAKAKVEKLMRDSTPSSGKITIGNYYNRDVELRVNGLDEYAKKAVAASTASPEEFLSFFRKTRGFENLKIGNVETAGTAAISARVEYDVGNLEGVTFVVDTTKGTSNLIVGRSWGWFGGGGPDEERVEYAKSLSSHPILNKYKELIEDNIANLPKLMLELRAWGGYNEKVLKPREQMLEIMNKDVEIYKSNTSEFYTDYMIYFQKNLKTKDKIAWIVREYFNPFNKSKNFFLEHLKKMEIRSEWAKLRSLAIIYHFADTISPLRHIYNEEENSPIRKFFDGSKVKILSEHNNQYGNFGSDLNSLTFKLTNFVDKKLDLKNILVDVLTRACVYLFNAHKIYANTYKKIWGTSDGIKLEIEYVKPTYEKDISIRLNIHNNVTCEINESPF